MNNKMKLFYNKYLRSYVNRETITYGITGVLTTLVNYSSYYVCARVASLDKYVSNTIAWVVAVTFAYVVNNFWVFQAKTQGIKEEIFKIIKFYSARIVSLGVEVLGLFVFYTLLGFNDLIVKAFLAVFVIIINYFFSKIFIFNKEKVSESL
jgi:putative flippase GtrA